MKKEIKEEVKETEVVLQDKVIYDKLPDFDTLIKVDLSKYITKRDDADYVNWAKIIELLHMYGAKEVWFEPIQQANGSSLIMCNKSFTDKTGGTNSVYETRIKVKIDELEFEMQGPVMNGANPVKDNSISQQRLWNSQTRLFVKGVAIHTGLGFKLWSRLEIEDEKKEKYSNDNILEVGKRVKEKMTDLMVNYEMTTDDIAKELNFESTNDLTYMLGYYKRLDTLEQAIDKLKQQRETKKDDKE